MEDPGDPTLDDPAPLRLRSCPACDYLLESLPPEGVCPECGRAYDQKFIVLTGRGRGQFDSLAGGTWRGMASSVGAVVVLLFVASFTYRTPHRWGWLPWTLVGLLALALQAYARLFSDREPGMQLWLSIDGVAQVGSTAEIRRAQRLSGLASWLVFPVVFVILLSSRRPPLQVLFGMLVLAVVLLALLARRRSWWWPTGQDDDAHAPNVTFGLWPWSRVERWSISPAAGGHVRVRMEYMQRWGPIKVTQRPLVDIELALTPEQATEMSRLISCWAPIAKS